jgi:hypothetical protein
MAWITPTPKIVAKFETNLYREWRLEGIARAKAAGVYKDRPASISDAAEVRAMKARLGASEIAKALKIGRVLVYRVLIKTHGRSPPWSKEIWLSECSTRLWPASALSGRGPAAVKLPAHACQELKSA